MDGEASELDGFYFIWLAFWFKGYLVISQVFGLFHCCNCECEFYFIFNVWTLYQVFFFAIALWQVTIVLNHTSSHI
jgi:hypothetical protein